LILQITAETSTIFNPRLIQYGVLTHTLKFKNSIACARPLLKNDWRHGKIAGAIFVFALRYQLILGVIKSRGGLLALEIICDKFSNSLAIVRSGEWICGLCNDSRLRKPNSANIRCRGRAVTRDLG
jgi:hypothetical protein